MFYTLTEEEYSHLKTTPNYKPSDIMIANTGVINIEGKLEPCITLQLNNGRAAVLSLTKEALQQFIDILSKD